MQTERVLVVGNSGSGKSRWVRDALIPAFDGKWTRLVVVNNSKEFAELCDVELDIDDSNADDGWNLEALIRDAGTVHFDVSAVDASTFLDRLGRAIYAVGHVLLVVDEADEFLPAQRAPRGLLQLYKGGRKVGVHVVTITQSLLEATGRGVSKIVVRQSTALVTFQQAEVGEVARITDEFPELGSRVRELERFDAAANAPPEYAVRDLHRGMSLIHGRGGVEWLSQRTGAGAAGAAEKGD